MHLRLLLHEEVVRQGEGQDRRRPRVGRQALPRRRDDVAERPLVRDLGGGVGRRAGAARGRQVQERWRLPRDKGCLREDRAARRDEGGPARAVGQAARARDLRDRRPPGLRAALPWVVLPQLLRVREAVLRLDRLGPLRRARRARLGKGRPHGEVPRGVPEGRAARGRLGGGARRDQQARPAGGATLTGRTATRSPGRRGSRRSTRRSSSTR